MAKAPALQFYPGDVQRDSGLSSCSLAAFGLWHRMMWAMFDGEPYGHLSVNGSVIPPDNLARLLRVTKEELDRYLPELEDAKVFSRTPEGVIFSRRMVRDAKRRETNALNGGKGGNPKLKAKGSRLSKSVNQPDKQMDNRQVIPLVADADSSMQNAKAVEEIGKGVEKPSPNPSPLPVAIAYPDDFPACMKTPEALAAWMTWEASRKQKRKPITTIARRLQLGDCEKWGTERAIAACYHSAKMDYHGLFEPKGEGTRPPTPTEKAQASIMGRNQPIQPNLLD